MVGASQGITPMSRATAKTTDKTTAKTTAKPMTAFSQT